MDTKCCRKTYCKECIITWINRNELCPNDRRILRANDLLNPSLIITNMLSFKIRCDFYDNGCQEIVSLGSLSRHLQECDYNICTDCGLKIGKRDEHNCVKVLKSMLIINKTKIEDSMNTNRHIMRENVRSIRKLNKKINLLEKQLMESDVSLNILYLFNTYFL